MIGWLAGVIVFIGSDHIILNVGGVGYLILCNVAIYHKAMVNQPLELWIEVEIRQDKIEFIGFADIETKSCYILLRSVQGVGAKLALAILNTYKPQAIWQLIAKQDIKELQLVPGVGAKLATRIANELYKQATKLVVNLPNNANIENNIHKDAISALTNLGFSKNDVLNIVEQILIDDPNLSLSELIKLSLHKLTSI